MAVWAAWFEPPESRAVTTAPVKPLTFGVMVTVEPEIDAVAIAVFFEKTL